MRSVHTGLLRMGVGLLVSAATAAPAMAQASAATNARTAVRNRVTVTGMAYDSLHAVPLANAFITIAEASRSTMSDVNGQFVFDTLPPGTYMFAVQHAAFDSLGLSGAQARVTVTDGRGVVTLAVPSFATLWTAACGALPQPASDSGLVYGAVRGARSQSPIPEAWIELSWLDLVNLGAKNEANVTQRRWKSETQSDGRGGYAVCGVPLSTRFQLRASYLTNATGIIDLPASKDRVRRRDLVVPGTSFADSALRGAVSGMVLDANGKPVADVRVVLDSVTEARTDRDGRFILASVPTGTRQMEFSTIGMTPAASIVDVLHADTTFVSATLEAVTSLEALNVTATTARRVARLFDERRRQGFGSFVDSTVIEKRGTVSSVFSTLPGVTVVGKKANGRVFELYLPSTGTDPCLAQLMVDGIQQHDHEILGSFYPDELAGIEVYQQRLTVPTELMRTGSNCGVIAVWTKRAFRR